MKADLAVKIAEREGAFLPDFYGEVVFKIKGGDVVLTKVTKEFIAEPTT